MFKHNIGSQEIVADSPKSTFSHLVTDVALLVGFQKCQVVE